MRYEVALIFSANNGLMVESETPEEAAEIAANSEKASVRLCHHCARTINLGDHVRTIVYDEGGNEVYDDDYVVLDIERLRAENAALQAEKDAWQGRYYSADGRVELLKQDRDDWIECHAKIFRELQETKTLLGNKCAEIEALKNGEFIAAAIKDRDYFEKERDALQAKIDEQRTAPVTKETWGVINTTLRQYRMTTMVDEDGDGYPLVDALSPDGGTILNGIDECLYLADEIYNAMLAAAPTSPVATGEAEALYQAKDALNDLLAGWGYIRETYGDLYGVGWDRTKTKGIAAVVAIDAAMKEKGGAA